MELVKILIITLVFSGQAFGETTWSKIGKEYSIDPVLLYAIALKESRRWDGKGGSTPWPWTLNAGKGLTFKSRKEAAASLTMHLQSGRKNIDVGLMQINLIYNGHRAKSPWALLEPETNIRVAAQILSENVKNSRGDIMLAVGKYYNNDPEKGKAYATHVLSMVSRMKNTKIEKLLN